MKKYLYILFILSSVAIFCSCSDDDKDPGNPILTTNTQFGNAMFGDSLPFTLDVSDADVPLSTVKAQLYFDEEKVSETIIRTKTNGEYSGKLYIPYYANIPNGTATLKLVLQNINFTITEKEYDLALTRPDYPYLTLVTEDADYQMKRIGLYQYELTDNLPEKVKGYIKAPAMGTFGNEITFGWNNNAIVEQTTDNIRFSNYSAGEYTISFNTLTYAAAPFISYKINNEEMTSVDQDTYTIDLNLNKDQKITFSGFSDIDNWWIDSDFFIKGENGNFTFALPNGDYRIIADLKNEYFIVEALKDNKPAVLQSDGTGAVWIIGDGIGKPSFATNAVGWDPSKALCMAPIGDKKYQITLVAGKTIKADAINFKFFHQKGWGGEFKSVALTTTSDIIYVGNGTNGSDDGNLGLVSGKSLQAGVTYIFMIDLSQGNDKAVLTVEKKS